MYVTESAIATQLAIKLQEVKDNLLVNTKDIKNGRESAHEI